MIKVNGEHSEAIIFSAVEQESAIEQVKMLCDQPFMKDLKIRIMPDYHAGKGCVIGTTIQLKDKVVPNQVGVDIGCGILVVFLGNIEIDFEKLDKVIRGNVPSGTGVHAESIDARHYSMFESSNFKASSLLNDYKTNISLGTLGGGNHFIEIAQDLEGEKYLLIHTGSRYLGAKVAQFHQKRAIDSLGKNDVQELIDSLKQQNRHSEIQNGIKEYKLNNPVIPKDFAFLEGELFDDYIHDMKLAQEFAVKNRMEIAATIINRMGFDILDAFDSIHNYIDTETLMLRKGATSAKEGERLVIPINMRDGSIIAVGKGNPDWNYSAPHGAGRVLSRTQASKQITLEEFRDAMSNVWTTSVSEETIDESPMAYKPMEEILEAIGETVEVLKIIKPIYNFKASDKFRPSKN